MKRSDWKMSEKTDIDPKNIPPYPYGARDMESHPHDETPPRATITTSPVTADPEVLTGAKEGAI